MKLPNKIRIAHIWFDIEYSNLNRKKSATYNIDKGKMWVEKKATSDDVLDSLIHECLEIYFVLKGYTYTNRSETHFIFRHEDFYKITPDLIIIFEQIFKGGKNGREKS